MSNSLRTLIASAILAHAFLGCCEHEDCHANETLSLGIVESTSCPGGHGDHADAPEPSEKSPPVDCGRCDCQWLTGEADAMQLANDYQYWSLCLVLTTCGNGDANLLDRRSISKSGHHHRSLHALGLRAHLAMSILLI